MSVPRSVDAARAEWEAAEREVDRAHQRQTAASLALDEAIAYDAKPKCKAPGLGHDCSRAAEAAVLVVDHRDSFDLTSSPEILVCDLHLFVTLQRQQREHGGAGFSVSAQVLH